MDLIKPKKKKNPISWLFRYLREAKEEMGKVTWPSKKEVIRYSLVVIIISIFIAAFFGSLDWLLSLGLEQLLKFSS
jgi:preprotein translocase subunit SecE